VFGRWVARRRKLLDLTQDDLARKVNCSLSMLRKIERDERRPSDQLAELLADHLAIDGSQRASFLSLARGKYIPDIEATILTSDTLVPALTGMIYQKEEPPPFVARERQLEMLNEHLEQAMQGQGRMVFIAGEAGQGKSSLLARFAALALETQPDLILAGGSSDVYTGQGDPLLPFRDIFRTLVGDIENVSMRGIINRELTTRLERTIPVITEILLDHGPHLIDTLVSGKVLEAHLALSYPHHPKNTEILLRLQAERARLASSPMRELRQDRLFDEISTTLNALAQRQPLMLMLDDLHWIDQSSAALLGHLRMRVKASPILIIGSYRPEDLVQRRPDDSQSESVQHPLNEVLSESLRQFGLNRIDLDHSEPGEELAFVNALLDVSENDFSVAFRTQLARLTEGHPLFIVELLRDMRERGDIIRRDDGRWVEREHMSWESIPARVEGVIEKRITSLPDELIDLLSVASVQGETFFVEVIAQVSQTDPVQLTRRLSAELDRKHRLIQAQGIKHTETERLSQYGFRHHLFHKYLYGRLAAAERMYLHEAVGDALEVLYAGISNAGDVPAAQLARHFREAHLGMKASKYSLRAGQQAVRVLAFDEASMHFERGIEELRDLDHTSEVNRLAYELRLALGRALWHSGRVIESLDVFKKTIEVARALDDPYAIARAVLAYEEPRWRLGMDAELSWQFMREALIALGEEQSGTRVRLLVGLSRSLLASGEQDELRTTVDQAVRIARQIKDPLALCDALRITAQIDRRPESTTTRLAAVQEMIATAESIGDQERLADGLDLYIYDLLELGQIDLVDTCIEVHRQVALEIKQPFQMHVSSVFQTMRAIMRGDFEAAEILAREAADLSQQIGIADMDGIFGMHMFTIRREQGRLHEVAPIVKLVLANNPESSTWRPGLALMYSSLGLREECQDIFERLAADGFAFVPQDSLLVAKLAYLSEVCSYLGDVDRAAMLYELLLPYDGRTVVVGGATACFGAVGRYLGLLARTMSDWEEAEMYFQQAIALDAGTRACPWLAHSQYEYATVLLEMDRAGDRQQANVLLVEALSAANKMGMAHLAEEVTRLQARYNLAMN
jgi:tetratricopeptide (TPR) repeat protein/transcriptional regulator with XRE-family HTH domain